VINFFPNYLCDQNHSTLADPQTQSRDLELRRGMGAEDSLYKEQQELDDIVLSLSPARSSTS
jgi:hypothetical protein